MPWFKITLAYDGADFCGWQIQPCERTVQGVVENAWHAITQEAIHVNASGRTDTGVHAIGQVVSLESATSLSPSKLVHALNAALPDDVAVRCVEYAPERFHATIDARWKHYRYLVYNSRLRPVMWRRRAWHVPSPLDVEAMQCAAERLVGTHDFVSFQTTGSVRQTTIRTLFNVEVRRTPEFQRPSAAPGLPMPSGPEHWDWETASLISIDVVGDGFLYHMVRAIAGTLVHVGRGRLTADDLARVLARRSRAAAGQTAPAHGLTLVEVGYD